MIIIHKEFLYAAPFVLLLLTHLLKKRLVDLSQLLIVVVTLHKLAILGCVAMSAYLLWQLGSHIQVI
jgi:hypothetical protein